MAGISSYHAVTMLAAMKFAREHGWKADAYPDDRSAIAVAREQLERAAALIERVA